MVRAHQCWTEEAFVALAAGAYDEERARELIADAVGCPECSLLLGEAGRAVADEAGDEAEGSLVLDGRRALGRGAVVAGRFLTLEWLGHGGMGEVYAALDTELGETVALKTIRPSLATAPGTIERFRQEARLARRVVHPHVCRVLEFGRHDVEGGPPIYFLTMELLRGAPLGRRLRQCSRLSALEATEIGCQLSAGLHAIHREGVLHGDVKTSNVILCEREPSRCDRDGSQGEPHLRRERAVLLDFGVARVQDASADGSASRALAGTPSYMSIEQLQGGALSTATDVYSLGVVLFELLTGQLPFEPTDSRSVALQHRLRAPEPSPAQLVPTLPHRLTSLVERCLRRDPRERPASAEALLRELEAVRQELAAENAELPHTRSDPAEPSMTATRTPSRRPSWARARRRVAALTGVIAIAAVGAAGVAAGEHEALARAPIPLPRASVASSAVAATPPIGGSSLAPVEVPPDKGRARPATPPRRSSRQHDVGSSATPAAPSSARPAPPAPSAVVRAPPTSRSDCSPPYYFDAEGFRVYRKECL